MGAPPFRIAVLGDLHYERFERRDYIAVRKQLSKLGLDLVVQLGDHGGYSHCGTRQSFEEGREFLQGMGKPFHTLIGNHDLEGPEFATDAESVAGFCQAFSYSRPFHSADWGPALGVLLSSTRFRDNPNSHHEVHVDDEQFDWLERTLDENRQRPTFVFSHAPILGSGVRVLQSIHLMCPNAWLNHTDRPERFIELVARHPQVKLWFSAHNHLGQQYPDSISVVGNCAFVHTGVIGDVTRDERRHSRLIECDDDGLTLFTFDHLAKKAIPDLSLRYADGEFTRLSSPSDEDSEQHFSPPAMPQNGDGWEFGESVFAWSRRMLIEFDRQIRAPLGVVAVLAEEPKLSLCDRVLCVETDRRRLEFPPNSHGRYWQVFAPNPYLAASGLP